LAEQLDGVRNLSVAVKEAGDRIIFLRKVERGKADRSYGIEVARLAGLPLAVIERAREVLKLHERTEHVVTEELAPRSQAPVQIRLFEPVGHGIAERIRNIKIDELRPIEALQLLHELQQELNLRGAVIPVVFIMISNHYPTTYGNAHNWIILSAIVVVGWVAAKIIRRA